MGFRKDSYARVWTVESVSDTNTKVRISISRKDKNTGEYVDEFGGFVAFYGSANAKKAACLKEGDRIKLGDVDVTSRYDKEKKVTYTNFKCFGFEMADGNSSASAPAKAAPPVDSGEPDDSKLPF